MAETFSPYRDWLGLDGVTSRPDHYRLLGLQPLEADAAVIRAAADRSLNRLRSTAPDGHDREWMQLMRELLEAEEALTEADKKVEYDQKFRGSVPAPAPMPPMAPQPQYAAPQPQYPQPQYGAPAYPPQQAYPPAQAWQQAASPMDPMAPMGAYGAPPPPPQPQYPPPAQPWTGGYQQPAYPPPAYPQPQYPPAYPNYYAQPPGYAQPQAYAVPPPPPVTNVPDPMAPLAFDAPPVESAYGPPAPVAPPEVGPRIGPRIGFHTAWAPPEAPTPVAPAAVAVPVTALAPAPVAVAPMAPPEPPPAPEAKTPEPHKDHRWKETKGEDEKKTKPVVSSKPFKLDAEDDPDQQDNKLLKLLLPLGAVVVVGLFVLITVNAYVNRPKQVVHQPPAHPHQNPEPPKPTPPQPTPPPKVDPPAEEPEVEPMPPPKPERPMRRPKPKPEPEEMPEEEMPNKPEPKPEPMKPVPPPDPPKPEPMPDAPKREDVIRLAKVLQEARVLARESKAEAAMEKLKEVESMAMTPAHRAKWDRLLFLCDGVRQCVAAIRETVPKLEGASTITIGSTVVSIVEGDTKKIIVRINGQNRTYNLDELPVGLGIALAEKSLDRNRPENLVIKGAYVVARSSDDAQIAKARGWWQEAISRGISECERLVPVIEDTYELEKELPRS